MDSKLISILSVLAGVLLAVRLMHEFKRMNEVLRFQN